MGNTGASLIIYKAKPVDLCITDIHVYRSTMDKFFASVKWNVNSIKSFEKYCDITVKLCSRLGVLTGLEVTVIIAIFNDIFNE